MANINDFRRRRLAAAAGNPERESWWRYARWRAARILGGITIGLLITIYLIARFGFSLIQDATEPDRQGPVDPNTGRARYTTLDNAENAWDRDTRDAASTAIAERTAVAEFPPH